MSWALAQLLAAGDETSFARKGWDSPPDAGVDLGVLDGAYGRYAVELLAVSAQMMTWDKAGEWARALGGQMPNEPELDLLFRTAPPHVREASCDPRMHARHWSSATFKGYKSAALALDMRTGGWVSSPKASRRFACAIRRIPGK